MTVAYCAVASMAHDDPLHPENSTRVPAIVEGLRRDGLLETMIEVPVAPATRDQVARCHDPRQIDALERRVAMGPAVIDPAPTYVTPASFDSALLSAGGAIACVTAVLDGSATAAIAIIRPPGHHAEPERAMGFCLFNNVAIAAREAQARGVERVFVFDFDVHHGNGTQRVFYTDKSVLFASTHQWGIYPGTGADNEMGAEGGLGLTMNVPYSAGAGDHAAQRVLDELVWPAADRFRPDLVIVSAGFDGHFRDPLANLQFSGAGFYAMAARLAEMAASYSAGRIVFVLEGGYDLPAIANGMANVVRGIQRSGPDDALGGAPYPEPDISELIARVRANHDL